MNFLIFLGENFVAYQGSVIEPSVNIIAPDIKFSWM